MFEGFIRLGSVELVNSERVEKYVAHQAPTLPFTARYNTDTLHIAAEDGPYESPEVDDAPWFDASAPATADFFGLYPLEVTGVGDSTLTAPTTESAGDGGSVGQPRDASRTIRVHGVLVGSSRMGTEAGLAWLREAVRSNECSQADPCGAGDFTYFLDVPDVCAEAYGDTEIDSVTESYGAHGVGTVSRQWLPSEVPLEMPTRARWLGTPRQGTRFIYGAKDRFTGEILEQHGPVTGLRRNYVPNPSFREDVDQWGAYNDAVVSWVLDDGADGLGYLNLDASAWVDSSPDGPSGDGSSIYGEGVYGEDVYGGDISGGLPPVTHLVTTVPTVSTVLLNVPAGPIVASLALRGDSQPVSLFILDPTGAVVASRDVQVSSNWERFALPATVGGPVFFAIGATTTADIDMVMVETGTEEGSYFDGSTDLAMWDGAPDESTSQTGAGQPIEISRDDGQWRPFITILEGAFDGFGLQWWLRPAISLEEQLEPYERTFHNVRCTTGVQIINRITSTSGAYFIEVDFLFTAGNPHPYSIPTPVTTTPLGSSYFTDTTPVAALDDDWLFDPNCLAPTPPPSAPAVPVDCIADINAWRRYYVAIPAQDVALWSASVPTVGINSKASPIEQVRVRLHPNPFGYTPEQVDPTDYCSEFIVSYLPAFTRLALNGTTRRAFATKGGKATVSADHLLYGTGGVPMSWPELTCGVAYVMTVDVPQTASIDDFDLDLLITKRE